MTLQYSLAHRAWKIHSGVLAVLDKLPLTKATPNTNKMLGLSRNAVPTIHNLSNTAIETTKNRCLERESKNSNIRVSRPTLSPLSYRVNGDWWWVYSIFKSTKYFRDDLTLPWMTCSVSILFQNHPERQRFFVVSIAVLDKLWIIFICLWGWFWSRIVPSYLIIEKKSCYTRDFVTNQSKDNTPSSSFTVVAAINILWYGGLKSRVRRNFQVFRLRICQPPKKRQNLRRNAWLLGRLTHIRTWLH